MKLTAARLRELLHYTPETGVFTWRVRAAICLAVGDVAGRIGDNGYRQIKIDYVAHLAHRLAWLYIHGEWPHGQIDHINGSRDDNRLANLRVVTGSQNQHNRHKAQPNKLGYPGLYLKRGRYGARLIVNGRQTYLGVYDTPEEAYAVYLMHRNRHNGLGLEAKVQDLEMAA